ncbi:uncharacterized protein LOC108098846 [Drosophila ficusphila]|uniref:uncharacterized protein LOC108098846 n=1 Tax=Drosophila ficusphila TaxID=30025 RepID=UPI0007E6101D|nr:uncharacterized protein LOC108098846 [Drosophila ficusphila]
MFQSNIAHPVIRQFILRTAVLNYLVKILQQQWDEWRRLSVHLVMRRLETEVEDQDEDQKSDKNQEDETSNMLAEIVDMLYSKTAASHRLLKREYDELFTYMMDKRDLWDSPEYFKAKAALGKATSSLRKCMPTKLNN